MSSAKLVVRDAAGLNPSHVAGHHDGYPGQENDLGDRLLFTTTAFNSLANVPVVSDYTLTNPIPASYFACGKARFASRIRT